MSEIACIVPVHNHERYVISALESISEQGVDCEIIVVDDGSTDSSYDIVMGFSSGGTFNGLPLTVLRHDKPKGPAAARNAGIRHAWDRAQLFFLLDSDDYYMPGKMEKSLRAWQRGPNSVGIVYSDYDTLNGEGLRLRQYKPAYERMRLLNECIINCDSLVSKRAFERAGLFNESLRVCEDYACWLRITSLGMVALHVPEPLVTVRVGPHSSSSTVPKEVWESCYRAAFEGIR